MAIVGCLDAPTSGRYTIDDVAVENMDENRLADVRGRKIGFVFQQFNLLARTSALENVKLPLTYAGFSGRERDERAMKALERVGLKDRADHAPNELSGGQQQRVAIARAIVNEPAILLADEPTGALDSKTGVEIMDLFQSLHRDSGQTVILVTHDAHVARHTGRIIKISDGKIVSDEVNPNPIKAGAPREEH
jgi:putative ABC transport system ATP-binding protein